LQEELGYNPIYQRNNEDIVTYANRIKILGKQILETCRNPGNDSAGQIIKASLERDICKCFIRGLKPEIEQRIAKNLGVQETVADALRIEKELQIYDRDKEKGQIKINCITHLVLQRKIVKYAIEKVM